MANMHIEDLRMGDLFLFWADRVQDPDCFRIYVITSTCGRTDLGDFVYSRYYIGKQDRWMRYADKLSQTGIRDPRMHYIGNCEVDLYELLNFVETIDGQSK